MSLRNSACSNTTMSSTGHQARIRTLQCPHGRPTTRRTARPSKRCSVATAIAQTILVQDKRRPGSWQSRTHHRQTSTTRSRPTRDSSRTANRSSDRYLSVLPLDRFAVCLRNLDCMGVKEFPPCEEIMQSLRHRLARCLCWKRPRTAIPLSRMPIPSY